MTNLLTGRRWSTAFAVLATAAALGACSQNTDLTSPRLTPGGPSLGLGHASAVVVSQVYGGGGNSGAPYKNDFVELYNPGTTTVSLSGWSIQYASATGTGNLGANSSQLVTLSGSIEPGKYFLVQLAGGSNGVALPTPDATGTINMAGGAGKVALVDQPTSIGCNGSSTPCSAAQLAHVIDLVGYGSANFYEGTSAAPGLSNTKAAIRKGNGSQDTNQNGADFTSGAPNPRNHGPAGPAGPLDHVTVSGPATVVVGGFVQLTASPEDVDNKPITGLTIDWSSSDDAVATVDATGKVTGVSASPTPVTITASATESGVTKSGTFAVTVSAPAIAWIDVGTNTSSIPPGFQAQLFLTARTGNGGTIVPATFTVTPLEPSVATSQSVGRFHYVVGVSPQTGSLRPRFAITATPVGGGAPYTFTTGPVTIETPVFADPGIYADNDEFGAPTPASAGSPNDMLIVRSQYVLSYNQSRGTPNWVSYELDERQFGTENRCNCFSVDPAVPAAKQVYYSDYTNSGYDRGHMTRSADRTAANVDNATTFYMTNIVPQTGDLNQGVWARFENALADSAEAGRAVYIITGPTYTASRPLVFINDEGKVAIPDSTWKIAFIGPRDGSGDAFTRNDVTTWSALDGVTVLAVHMPNVTGVRDDAWSKYLTTVDAIEASTGYDFLSLLPVAFQAALESGDRAPTAAFTAESGRLVGEPVAFDASASSDPDAGDVLTYAWNFGDGATGTGVTPTHAYANAGTYQVALLVADKYGWQRIATRTVTVLSSTQALGRLADAVAALVAADKLTKEEGHALDASLDAAAKSLAKENETPAANQLAAFVNKVEALQQSGRLSAADADALIAYARRVIASL